MHKGQREIILDESTLSNSCMYVMVFRTMKILNRYPNRLYRKHSVHCSCYDENARVKIH
jgi:hypothetical protein